MERKKKRMKNNQSYDLSQCTVEEAIELLQTLPKRCMRWPIACCGSDSVFLNIDAKNHYIVFDEENLFETKEEWNRIP